MLETVKGGQQIRDLARLCIPPCHTAPMPRQQGAWSSRLDIYIYIACNACNQLVRCRAGVWCARLSGPLVLGPLCIVYNVSNNSFCVVVLGSGVHANQGFWSSRLNALLAMHVTGFCVKLGSGVHTIHGVEPAMSCTTPLQPPVQSVLQAVKRRAA